VISLKGKVEDGELLSIVRRWKLRSFCSDLITFGQTDGGFFMSKKRETRVASDGGPELTSAGVPWSEVPEFARADVAWIDGRHGSAQSSLPSVDVVPVPDILHRLPYLHENRPVDRKPCWMPQARGHACGTCVLALGSSVLTAAGSGPSGRVGT
jgi:hypothetical protein